MKKLLAVLSISSLLLATITVSAQDKNEDKSKRPSPPAKVTQTISSGAVVSIDYSQPSVKGRTIGKNLEPMIDSVWRTGANEATVFETSKDLTIGGQKLPAGKYEFFSIAGTSEWTIIFNKTLNQWGAYTYKQADDVIRVKAKVTQSATSTEKFTITISKSGLVTLLWGTYNVTFTIQ